MAENNQAKPKKSTGQRGGRRPGAGRKPGSATVKTREIADAFVASAGVTPLEYMLSLMNRDSAHEDPKVEIARETLRFEAAKAAAPYVHPRLQAIEHAGPGGKELPGPATPIINLTMSG